MSQFTTMDLIKAIAKGNLNDVEKILNTSDVNVNSLEDYRTPLTVAVRKDQIEIVDLLFIQYS